MTEAETERKVYWFWRPPTGRIETNVPRRVVYHSPDGFEFGYGGSGPADLALNILEDALRSIGFEGPSTRCGDSFCFALAWNLHQQFKWDFIAGVKDKRGGRIPLQKVLDWIREKGGKIDGSGE